MGDRAGPLGRTADQHCGTKVGGRAKKEGRVSRDGNRAGPSGRGTWGSDWGRDRAGLFGRDVGNKK